MNIKTKYSSGDKVWFYIEEYNSYAWGKIVSLDVAVRCNQIETSYYIENRFFDENLYLYSSFLHRESIKYQHFISLKEKEVFELPEEIRTYLEQKHFKKMSELKELKKGWFR